jgi:hypothetical protein
MRWHGQMFPCTAECTFDNEELEGRSIFVTPVMKGGLYWKTKVYNTKQDNTICRQHRKRRTRRVDTAVYERMLSLTLALAVRLLLEYVTVGPWEIEIKYH